MPGGFDGSDGPDRPGLVVAECKLNPIPRIAAHARPHRVANPVAQRPGPRRALAGFARPSDRLCNASCQLGRDNHIVSDFPRHRRVDFANTGYLRDGRDRRKPGGNRGRLELDEQLAQHPGRFPVAIAQTIRRPFVDRRD